MEGRRPVRQLSVDVARKIAAGEVIDRPNAIVRELLDNAVDSGADTITAEITGGGIEKIRISDNGYGMSKEDLENCARPHCTSKIVDSADLMNLSTLGFRGEALASIAAVSRLTISSGTNRMTASISDSHRIESIPLIQNGKGTVVQSEGLFENFPARRVFLKRPASETLLCRETFIEKSLPRTDIAFRLIVDGSIRYDLPSGVSLSERFVRALELKESSQLFSELKNSGTEADGKTKWSFSLIIGEPSIYRNDRKHIFIYVNGRRVQEYSLLQAIEYGCQGFFPNGVHPVAALYLNVDPKTVDFNIHPAKKEVRFKDIASIHHGVSSTVKNYFRNYGIKASHEIETEAKEFNFSASEESVPVASSTSLIRNYESNPWKMNFSAQSSFEKKFDEGDFSDTTKLAIAAITDSETSGHQYASNLTETTFSTNHKSAVQSSFESSATENSLNIFGATMQKQSAEDLSTAEDTSDFKFIGSALGTFILVQVKNTLYMVDQHAAHERILFNKLMSGGGEKQNLLIPYRIKTDSKEDDQYLENVKEVLANIGFCGKNTGDGIWEFSTVPARWTGNQEDLQEALLESRTPAHEIMYKIAAMTACKAAVKDGTILDSKTAENLAKEALKLSDPHCPHGRPVWTSFTKEQLFARVRRT